MKLELKNDIPVYISLKNSIINDIRKGKLEEGGFFPQERKLCKELRVSRDTVRRAFEELETEGFVVRQIGKKRPVVGTGSLVNASLNSSIIGYISRVPLEKKVDGIYNDLANVFISIAADLISESLGLVYLNPRQMNLTPTQLIRRTANAAYGGLIYFLGSGQISEEEITELKNLSCPVVAIESYPPKSIISLNTVELDNYQGGKIAARFLRENGHKKISHLNFSDKAKWLTERERGFRDELDLNALTCDTFSVDRSRPASDAQGLYEYNNMGNTFKKIIAAKPTAVFAATDFLATEFIKYAANKGLHIPEDISVMGFDNMTRDCPVPLTSISHMTFELAERASEILIKQVKNPQKDYVYREQIRPVLVARNSVRNLNK